eukprot:Blabericola_migrator_1__7233@NODE_3672_length_1586_cov_89_633970_g376_i3_p2_GENE_NODE_3672_length_1586_cov_89_633970_g376_i3NODE_3672_length_1586_cov_89_633970_g376_i3_p2_ORF_typecomplete_len137_score32_89_NODE_3672_length_1586_cov_89_633970_g376_i393503
MPVPGAVAPADVPPGAPPPEGPKAVPADGQFDEMINRNAISIQDYFNIGRKRPYETQDMTLSEKYHWNYPRRWKIALYGITLVNLMDDELNAFLDFEIGTNRDEYRVESDQWSSKNPGCWSITHQSQNVRRSQGLQ